MKAILMSIKAKWCEKIFSGEKTVVVRKTAPKLKTPFKVYVYRTKEKGGAKIINDCLNSVYGGGKVVGEFVCDEKHDIQFTGESYMINNDISLTNRIATQSCLQFDDMFSYLGARGGVAIHIAKPKRYDTPKELGEFLTPSGTGGVWGNHYLSRPPQSWQYVEELE